jgi:hypothetical protein
MNFSTCLCEVCQVFYYIEQRIGVTWTPILRYESEKISAGLMKRLNESSSNYRRIERDSMLTETW